MVHYKSLYTMNEFHRKSFICLFLVTFIIFPVFSFRFLLLHTNDMHSRYTEIDDENLLCRKPSSECYGGFARLKAAVKHYTSEAEKRGMPTLYLDAGDVFRETVYHIEFQWKLAVKMMNLLRPRAMCLGNHEFDDGIVGLVPFIENLEVPLICCNIDISQEPRLKNLNKIKPSTIITIGKAPNVATIGIVGYLTQNIPRNLLGNAKILDEIQSLRTETKRLREVEKVNIIIGLGHSGYDVDKKIAEEVEEIDLIVGGHTHTFLYNNEPPTPTKIKGEYPTFITPKNKKDKRIPIVQAYFATKYLGYIELEFDDKWTFLKHEGLPILLKGDMEQDAEILNAIQTEVKIIDEKYHTKIGFTEFTFKGKTIYCRYQECTMGNLVTDAFVYYVNKHYQTKDRKPVAHIGLVHSAAIKGALYGSTEDGHTGDIVLEDLVTALPFGCSLEVLKLKGSVLREILEHAVDKYDRSRGEKPQDPMFYATLMQVSGLKVKYDLTKNKGSRLISVKVRSKNGNDYSKLKDNEIYNTVMPEYLAQGNEFKILAEQERVIETNKDVKDYDVVGEFIKERKIFKSNGEYSDTEGRLTLKFESKNRFKRISNWLSKLMKLKT